MKNWVKSGPPQPQQYLITALQQLNHREIQFSVLRGQERKTASCLSDTCCFTMKTPFPFLLYITEPRIPQEMCCLQNKTSSDYLMMRKLSQEVAKGFVRRPRGGKKNLLKKMTAVLLEHGKMARGGGGGDTNNTES